jgi:serine/threonine protein kinase
MPTGMSVTQVMHSVDIPGYRILRSLGEGGMASVYLAMQESLDREVALKVMAPSLSAYVEFTVRFLKEGRLTAKLRHPNLVTVYDWPAQRCVLPRPGVHPGWRRNAWAR